MMCAISGRAGALAVRLAAALVAAAAFAAPGDASAAGRVETSVAFDSPALGHAIPAAVYRPDPEHAAEGARLPVLYLFHGLGGRESDWVGAGDIAATLDREIAAGRVQPLIVVMPMAGDSWYVDDPAGKSRMATAFTTDLVAAVDARYPTAACRQARATGGLSMGGYGALLYAFDRPDLYGAAISLSGSIFAPIPEGAPLRPGPPVTVFGAAFGEPFDRERFNAWTLFPKVATVAAQVERPAVFLTAGDDDFLSLVDGTVRLHIALKRAGMDSELRIQDGRHDWANWKAAVVPALAWLSARLDPSCGTENGQ
jgi:enterochelin esterase family protein